MTELIFESTVTSLIVKDVYFATMNLTAMEINSFCFLEIYRYSLLSSGEHVDNSQQHYRADDQPPPNIYPQIRSL